MNGDTLHSGQKTDFAALLRRQTAALGGSFAYQLIEFWMSTGITAVLLILLEHSPATPSVQSTTIAHKDGREQCSTPGETRSHLICR
ncbi:hypothetical protein KPH14_003688 [Odynerus spinipes]|uniref:Uncharacterized protein n=1 Tax=Odynerus spinipes TaxID=1348599 RepID=A0AAD9RX44_9HYME|nr:hypothetical protein KPH14_003688 [Odynerus spinipes]